LKGINHCKKTILVVGGAKMGKDRQEKKLKKSRRVESDRDVGLKYKNSTIMSSPEEAMELNDGKK
jgi:YpzI-like protein